MSTPTADLLDRIYAVLADPSAWTPCLQAICADMHAIEATLALFYPNSPSWTRVFTYGMTEEDLRIFYEKWADQDPWYQNMHRLNPTEGLVGRSSELISDEDLEKTEIYQQFLGPRGFHHGVGAFIRLRDSHQVFLSVARPKESGPFADEQLDLIRSLIPHLQRVTDVLDERQRAVGTQEILQAYLDTGDLGLFLLNGDGVIISANTLGKAYVEEGKVIYDDRGKLRARSPELERELRQAILQTGNPAPDADLKSLRLPSKHSGPRFGSPATLRLLVSPLGASLKVRLPHSAPSVSVLIFDPTRQTRVDEALLQEFLNLSRAECRVAVHLASGRAPAEIAEMLSVSVHTVRSHLKSMYAKTNTSQQHELVSLLIRVGR